MSTSRRSRRSQQADTLRSLGYKLRTSIWKGLKSRGKAIQTQLRAYNGLAKKLHPPAPQLDFKTIVNLTFVADFDILRNLYGVRNSAPDKKPWMEPGNRELMNRLFKIIRAHEERIRLNVEIGRLRQRMFMEDEEYRRAIANADGDLAQEIHEQWVARCQVNDHHLVVLSKIEKLDGFTGVVGKGAPSEWLDDILDDDGESVGGDDQHQDECDRLAVALSAVDLSESR